MPGSDDPITLNASGYDLLPHSPAENVFVQRSADGAQVWQGSCAPLRIGGSGWFTECLTAAAFSPDGRSLALLNDQSLLL